MAGALRPFRCSLRDKWTLAQAFFWVAAVRVGLGVLPFRTLRRLQRRASRLRVPAAAPSPVVARRISRAVGQAGRLVPGAKCLAEAMAGQVLLARAGLASKLRIGVAHSRQAHPLDAHAWLESGGRAVLGESEPGHYTTLSGLR